MEVGAGTESLLGTTIDERIEIQSVLGSGGMGTVYKGFHKGLQKPVAIKVLAAAAAQDAQALIRFKSEADSLSALDHRNVVKILQFGVLNEQAIGAIPYLVLEYILGESLQQRLTKPPMPLIEIWQVLKQLSAGVAAAHALNIVHRDLKPSNIMFDGDIVKIVDFGISKSLTTIEIQKLTQTGALLGTPFYMSPEQLASQPASKGSDIYSLGCILYEMLYAKPYASGDNILEIAMNKMSPSSALGERTASGAGVPKALRALLAKMLEPDPLARVPDAIELTRLITKVQTDPEMTHSELNLPVSKLHRIKDRSSAAPLVFIFALVASTAVIALTAVTLMNTQEQKVLNSMSSLCIMAKRDRTHELAPWELAQASVQNARRLTNEPARRGVADNIRMLADERVRTGYALDSPGFWFIQQAANLPATTASELDRRFEYAQVGFTNGTERFKEREKHPEWKIDPVEQFEANTELLDVALETARQLHYQVRPDLTAPWKLNLFVGDASDLIAHHSWRYRTVKSEADRSKGFAEAKALLEFINTNPAYFEQCTPGFMQQLAVHICGSLSESGQQLMYKQFVDSLTSGSAADLWRKMFAGNDQTPIMWQAQMWCNDGNVDHAKEADEKLNAVVLRFRAQNKPLPQLDGIHQLRGRALFSQGRFEDALSELNASYQLAMKDPTPNGAAMMGRAKMWQAHCFIALHRYKQAEESLRDAQTAFAKANKAARDPHYPEISEIKRLLNAQKRSAH